LQERKLVAKILEKTLMTTKSGSKETKEVKGRKEAAGQKVVPQPAVVCSGKKIITGPECGMRLRVEKKRARRGKKGHKKGNNSGAKKIDQFPGGGVNTGSSRVTSSAMKGLPRTLVGQT